MCILYFLIFSSDSDIDFMIKNCSAWLKRVKFALISGWESFSILSWKRRLSLAPLCLSFSPRVETPRFCCFPVQLLKFSCKLFEKLSLFLCWQSHVFYGYWTNGKKRETPIKSSKQDKQIHHLNFVTQIHLLQFYWKLRRNCRSVYKAFQNRISKTEGIELFYLFLGKSPYACLVC